MSAIQFWKCTPRKLHALCKVHADLNDPDSKKKKEKQKVAFVDQLSFM